MRRVSVSTSTRHPHHRDRLAVRPRRAGSASWLLGGAIACALAWPAGAREPDFVPSASLDTVVDYTHGWDLDLVPLFALAAAAPPAPPVYEIVPPPPELEATFTTKKYKRDEKSGNYLSPKVMAKTPNQELVPIFINGKYVKDLRGQPVFLRSSIRDKLLAADKAMFEKKQKHIVVNYGFRSNVLQQELWRKLNGKAKVAPAGSSFHETGMALDISNWREAQGFMIDAGFVGGCYGIEEDLVHYSIGEITKASNGAAFKRCTLRELPQTLLKGVKKVGNVFRRK